MAGISKAERLKRLEAQKSPEPEAAQEPTWTRGEYLQAWLVALKSCYWIADEGERWKAADVKARAMLAHVDGAYRG